MNDLSLHKVRESETMNRCDILNDPGFGTLSFLDHSIKIRTSETESTIGHPSYPGLGNIKLPRTFSKGHDPVNRVRHQTFL